MLTSREVNFLLLARTTLLLVYLVILAGAVVRATGSGMGCPDWPKCFGRWIPPTNESELPANYQQIYKASYADTPFNVYHTWTEYVNRLMGALLGIAVFALLIAAIRYYRNTDRSIIYLCFFGFILVGFQGWLGAKVVSSNLAPVKITIHMLVALIILGLYIYIINRVKKGTQLAAKISAKHIKYIFIFCLMLSVIQVLLGTQVREEVDLLAKHIDNRSLWMQYLGSLFKIHRSFAWLVVVINLYAVLMLKKISAAAGLIRSAYLIIGILLVEVVIGIVLVYFSFPAILQPVHLFLACVMFGTQFSLLNKINTA